MVALPTRTQPRWQARLSWAGLLLLCSAYLQGGLAKALDFPAALAEMQHFGVAPAAPMALATIVLELGASLMVLANFHRRPAALALGAFTLVATFLANRFWEIQGAERLVAANGFFEHLGLAGAFLLVACLHGNPSDED